MAIGFSLFLFKKERLTSNFIACPKSEGFSFRVLGLMAPGRRVPGLRLPGLGVLGLKVLGPRIPALKELRNCIIRVWSLFYSHTGLYKSAFSTYSFGKTRFSSFCVLVFRVSVSLAFNF